VHNGLTVLPQTDKFLHGTKVAYGILVQSALLGQGMGNDPVKLCAVIDINLQRRQRRRQVKALPGLHSIHYLPVTLTPGVLRAAFEKVEYFSR
jgi:uncharacterized oxidoreductase